jgi:hypothetical protein
MELEECPMTTKVRSSHLRLGERPASARIINTRDIPPESYASARDRVRQVAKTRAGMVCGVVIVALIQFVPEGGSHGLTDALLAILPAVVIAAVAFPLIAWALRRDEAGLRTQYDIRRR